MKKAYFEPDADLLLLGADIITTSQADGGVSDKTENDNADEGNNELPFRPF